MTKEFNGHERRKTMRYDTGLEIQFRVNFDLKTRILFKITRLDGAVKETETYSAVGRNINVEGLCFHSPQRLGKGDHLRMDVFLPSSKESIPMEGRVLWCRPYEAIAGQFESGVKILKVKGEEVEKTIALDPVYKTSWSIVLESVLGGFKEKILKDKKLL